MDSPTLTALLAIALASSAFSAYVAYWMGISRAERASAQREQDLLDALQDATDTVARLCRDRHPAGKERSDDRPARHLYVVGGEA